MKRFNILLSPEVTIFFTGLIITFALFSCEKDPQDSIDPDQNPEDTIPSCWTELANMQTSRATHMMFSIDHKLYVAGNRFGGNSLETYDPETDSWKMLASMSDGREFSAGCAINGKIYAVGGYENPDKYYNSLEEYDPETDRWNKKSPMSTPRIGHAAVVLEDKIYVIGGATGWPITEYYTSIEVYDPKTDTWRTIPSPTSSGFKIRWEFSACVVNGRIYAIGGIKAASYPPPGVFYDAQATVQEYNPANNTWVDKASLPTASFGLAVASVNNMIYAFGGTDGFNPTQKYATVETDYRE